MEQKKARDEVKDCFHLLSSLFFSSNIFINGRYKKTFVAVC